MMSTVVSSANLVEAEAWKRILGDTPPRLEVDFASSSPGEGLAEVATTVTVISGTMMANIQELCAESEISEDAFVLWVLYHTLRAYSHEAFAIGVCHEGGNILLVPFQGNRNGGMESLQDLHDRWKNGILPYSKTSYDEVKNMGYGCSVSLLMHSSSSLNNPRLPHLDSSMNLFVKWMECSSGDGSIKVSFESGIGPWPDIEDRFQLVISQILTSKSQARSSPSTPNFIDNLLPCEKELVLQLARGPEDQIIDCCLHEMVEQQARMRPDATALLNKSGTETMTYAELDAQAHRLALELQRRGAKPNTYVGILMGEKTFEMHVAVLGVLKSGAAYVPMDAVLFPPERIKFIAEDTDMKLLVTVGEHVDLVEGGFEKVLVEEAVENTSHDGTELERLVKPSDCAYMIYTSGTTGVPKGVVCDHIGPVNMIFHKSGEMLFSNGTPQVDVVGCAAPVIFDVFVYGYFGTLGNGLALSLDMKCCTMLICTPSVADIFLQDETNNINVMLVGGEACIQGLESRVATFINGYGPTEASIFSTAGNRSDTIGRPLPNTLCYCYVVHPDDGTLCPPGVSGELWVGGIGVGIGYHNRPELTAEKFIPNPFGPGRVYKTGDRVKWDKDGEIVYLGRFDHQVKVRGYRIELGEIQAELEKQGGVSGALVVVYEEKLVAFVASGVEDSSQNDALAETLMEALKNEDCSLASYMVPSRILVMEEFPLTLNGKIDRKHLITGLEETFNEGYGFDTEYVSPTTKEEIEMVKLWKVALDTDRDIGMNDSFYDLGGHSILAMSLAAALGCDSRLISAHPSPSSLLAHLQESRDTSATNHFKSLEESLELTRTEQRMVFIQLQDPHQTTYNIPFCVQFNEDIDVLTNTQTVVDALPILHTRFANGKAIEDVKILVEDLARAVPDDIQRLLYSAFDMGSGPLCRFGVDRKSNLLYGNIHHSIADGRSLQILFEAINAGVVKSPTKSCSMRKYSAVEALPEVVEEQQASVEKYVELLGDTPPRLEVDFASANSYYKSSIILDSATRAALEGFCRKEKISLFSLALGVMHKSLRAYSHEAFTIGTAFDSRPSYFRDTLGMFVNTVLIPFGKGAEGNKETLKQLNDRWTNCILPLATAPFDLVSAAGYGTNLCLAFNVGVIDTSASDSAPRMQPLPKLQLQEGNGYAAPTAMFDLTVEWTECSSADGSIEISFESGIGPWPDIEDRFQHIISQILTSKSQARSSPSTPNFIDNLLPCEKELVLQLARGPEDQIIDCCLHEMVEQQARMRPDATALLNKSGTETMTYAELDAQAHRLALELQRRGAKPNTYVGILMGEKTFEMHVAVLGVLKSGAAYVPMDAVLFPPERIKFIAEDTDMKLLVTVGEHVDLVEGGFEKVLVEEAVENTSHDGTELERLVKPSDCAYMIYTSGTTGVPKGVVCDHIGPVNMIFHKSGEMLFSNGTPQVDVVGCKPPFVFDFFVYGYFGTLGNGLALSLDMKCCTMLMCTPSVADIFLQDQTNNINVLCVGGEACIQGLESKVATFINICGPTEVSIFSTAGNRSDTIGRPLPNTLCYVVHPDDGLLCPPGVSGELWVGGIGVGIGYHNRPELTAEKFIPNPFGPGRVYKTGDRVKWDKDGEIVYLGRFDHQVKVRGYRIELGEIQAELEKQGGVSGALVVVYEEKLVAFVASGIADNSQNDALAVTLMEALKNEDCSLASYMVPSLILVMEEFPLTLNGKIDRKYLLAGLEETFNEGYGFDTEYVSPATKEEKEMVEQWQAVLGADKDIGMNDNFYDLGGHSILAMSLAAALDCDVRFIAAHPTPASLLTHLQCSCSTSSREKEIFASLDEVPALTRTEQRMVFIQLQDPHQTTYNIPFCVQFNEDIDVLTNTQTVVDALPILHTRFANGKAIEDVKILVEDLARAVPDDIQRLLYSAFDMGSGPLCRFGVDRKSNLLYGNIHHSIADGRSLQILFEAINAGVVKSPTKSCSMRKYSAVEALPEVVEEQQASVEKYVELLGDTPPRLEVDFASANSYYKSSIILDSATRAALEGHCRRERISLFSLALGVMHKSLRAYSHEAFTIGTAFDSRPSYFRDTLGMFVNTVLIPFGKGAEGNKETLKQLNDRWINQFLPLATAPFDLVSAAGYGTNLCLAFNVGVIDTSASFSASDSAPRVQSLPELQRENGYAAPTAKFDLTVDWTECSSADGSIKVSFESGIGPWPDIEDRFQLVISQILTSKSQARSSPSTPNFIDNLLPCEKELVLQLARGPEDQIIDCCLHEMVEQQARMRPDATALLNKSGTETMTYAELDAQAHRLALELQRRGAKPNTYVGILMGEKTFEMHVAVLGVLKSGAAYVPMDAVLFPPERIKFIAEDTDMKLLVTVGEHVDLVEGGFEKVLVEEAVENTSHDGTELERLVKPSDCAYMIYTSGTTGVPKGVVCDHIGPVNMIFHKSGEMLFSNGTPQVDVVGCKPPFVFDFFVYGYFGTLGNGLALSLDMKCCTMLMCTPSVADIFLQDQTNNINVLCVGGEACIQGLESKVATFINICGPTEVSIFSTAGNRSDTIGRPLPNTLCYVVHPDDGLLCPPGVSGELWVGGIGVGIGYHNRPELTAEKFIPNPFGPGRVYKTGDRVKWDKDGEIVYLGRFDHQVKVRGYRIELGEIQAELEKQGGVSGALVVVVVYEEKLVAFVASGIADNSQNDALAVTLMEALKNEDCSLASYMVPSLILVMEEFPLTLNGKIDRKYLLAGLEETFNEGYGFDTEYVSPATKEEKEMVEQWQAVLGADKDIGMNDNFYDLGGHSILAMSLAAALDCDVRFIAAHPTPASLLTHLQCSCSTSSREKEIFASLDEVPALTRTEQRMVFIQLQDPHQTTYNIPFCVQFNEDIDVLTNTQTVVDALPILHTRFANGKAIEDVKILVEDLARAVPDDIQRLLYSAFDMGSGPLCRFGVDRKSNLLYGNIHHSIADGRSLQILFEAINAGVVKSPTKSCSMRKYSAVEALPEVVEEQQASVEKYVELLGDTPPRLEVDFASANSYYKSSIILDSATRAALEGHCRRERISLFSLALGVMHKSLRAYSHEAFTIGTAFDSRPSYFRDTLGMFVNTVLIPFGKGAEGNKETLKQLNDRWINQFLPLATAPFDLVSAAGYGTNLCLAFNVGVIDTSASFSASDSAPRVQSLPELQRENGYAAPTAKFDLTVDWTECSSADGSIKITIESGIGPWPDIEDRFQHIISQILTSKSQARSSPSTPNFIDNLLPCEKELVLQLARGPEDQIIDCCLHEMVEQQARMRPDATALLNKSGTETMTYAELDAQAHRLALELQRRGAKPNTYVGILMGEKTFEMHVAVLGVLKSGAAYVPMDAVLFPPERIKFIAEDTDMKLLVTVGEHVDLVEGGFEKVLVEEAVENTSHDGTELERLVKPSDCAYMIYTSGTTGVPKGVVCDHIGPVNMIFHKSGEMLFSNGTPQVDVVGCAAPVIFDVFVYGYFGTLGNGLALSLDMKCCTMLICTPSVADIFLQDETNNINVMLVGGEACIQGLESRVATFINGYGPTEASIFSTAGNRSDTIGRPLPNTLCYVVHPDDGTLCPPGVSGELWVGGIGVGIGYHNRPELTAEKFIPNPFGPGRVYKTGDRVKWDKDGEIVYLGRFDHQVKVRGYRIELGEIQAELEKQGGVSGALVVVYEEKLVAFVASGIADHSQNDALAVTLMEALKNEDCSLASYMVPWKILVMEEFPLTLNGKIDRKSLVISFLPRYSRASDMQRLIPPRTSTQKFMCKLFKDILQIDVVGIDCDFMDLGGHSLLVMQAVGKIRVEFDIDSFTVRQFIELKTARNIGQKIDEYKNERKLAAGYNRLSTIDGSSVDINSTSHSWPMMKSELSSDEKPALKILIKTIAVLVLFVSCGIAILPANILLSTSLEMSWRIRSMQSLEYSLGKFQLFTIAILGNIAAWFVFFSCLVILARFCGYLLFNSIGKGPTTIKRSSATYGLWYVFDRLWFVSRMGADLMFRGTKFHTWFYNAFGCSLGKNNFFEDADVRLPFMLTTGNNVVVEAGAKLETLVIMKNGDVAVDEIVLGDNTVIGPNTHIGLGAKIGASCWIKSLSLVQQRHQVADSTEVMGHEVTETELEQAEGGGEPAENRTLVSFGWHLLFLLISFIPAVMNILLVILISFLASSNAKTFLITMVLYPVWMSIGEVFIAVFVRLLRYLLIGKRAQPGWERVYSMSFLRRNTAMSLYHSAILSSEGTVISYLITRFAFGAVMDVKNCFSPLPQEPDLTRIGRCTFGANGVQLRNTSFRCGGIVRYGNVNIGDHSMILDRAVISPDTSIEKKVMVGPMTSVNEDTSHDESTLLLGTPALTLSRKVSDVQMEITNEPTTHLLLHNFLIMYFKLLVRVLIALAFYANGVIFYLISEGGFERSKSIAVGISFGVFPFSIIALVVVLLSLCLLIKWVVIGDFRKLKSKGLIACDSLLMFKWLVCNSIVHEASEFPLMLLDEFWVTATFWKLMGAKIGKNTLIDPNVLILETDLLEIGDDCRIEEETTLLCHKFNDGGLKLGNVVIPSSCSLHARSVFFPEGKISDENVTLLPLTPLNPGETLSTGHWKGSPAERVDTETEKLVSDSTHRSTLMISRSSISTIDIV